MKGAKTTFKYKQSENYSKHFLKFIDSTIAVVLVVVSLATAEPPRFRASARQTAAPGAFQPPAQSAPYNPRGWRPQGAAFTLPKSQPQQAYGPPSPAPSYGPPPLEPTTEDNLGESTEPPQIQVGKITSNSQASASKTTPAAPVQQTPGSYYVVLPENTVRILSQPQSQNLLYAVTEVQKSAPLVTVPQATILAAPLTSAQVQPLPVSTFNAVYSPLTGSYVIYS